MTGNVPYYTYIVYAHATIATKSMSTDRVKRVNLPHLFSELAKKATLFLKKLASLLAFATSLRSILQNSVSLVPLDCLYLRGSLLS